MKPAKSPKGILAASKMEKTLSQTVKQSARLGRLNKLLRSSCSCMLRLNENRRRAKATIACWTYICCPHWGAVLCARSRGRRSPGFTRRCQIRRLPRTGCWPSCRASGTGPQGEMKFWPLTIQRRESTAIRSGVVSGFFLRKSMDGLGTLSELLKRRVFLGRRRSASVPQ